MSEDVKPYGASDDETAQRANELRALTAALGMSQRAAARALELDERTMRYYFSAQHDTPIAVIYALRYLVSAADQVAQMRVPSAADAVAAAAATRVSAAETVEELARDAEKQNKKQGSR